MLFARREVRWSRADEGEGTKCVLDRKMSQQGELEQASITKEKRAISVSACPIVLWSHDCAHRDLIAELGSRCLHGRGSRVDARMDAKRTI